MTSKPGKKSANRNIDLKDLRDQLASDEGPTDDVRVATAREVDKGTIFGLSAGERMILSIILFLAVSVLSVALLFITGTIALR